MMKSIKTLLTVVAVMLVGVGYVMSQVAFFAGNAQSYAKAIDTSGVQFLAAMVLVGSIVIAIIENKAGGARNR